MAFDEQRLLDLTEESQDLQSDALRDVRAVQPDLKEFGRSRLGKPVDLDKVRAFNDQRRRLLRNGGFGLGALAARGFAATGFGAAITAIVAAPAHAQADVDVQILNTASSLENLAIVTYEAALGLPFIAEDPVVSAFAETTMMQHSEHSDAFNASATAMGGNAQNGVNKVLAPMVEEATAALTDAPAVVDLASMLEEVAGDTYLANLAMLQDTEIKSLMASVMGVEVQHLVTLRAVGVLLAAGVPEGIAIPVDPAVLPAAAGSAPFPEALAAPDMARAPEEGFAQ
ncbi:hypothetical protein BH20ACT2_BH20ACT2_12500 [soil metagenome]